MEDNKDELEKIEFNATNTQLKTIFDAYFVGKLQSSIVEDIRDSLAIPGVIPEELDMDKELADKLVTSAGMALLNMIVLEAIKAHLAKMESSDESNVPTEGVASA